MNTLNVVDIVACARWAAGLSTRILVVRVLWSSPRMILKRKNSTESGNGMVRKIPLFMFWISNRKSIALITTKVCRKRHYTTTFWYLVLTSWVRTAVSCVYYDVLSLLKKKYLENLNNAIKIRSNITKRFTWFHQVFIRTFFGLCTLNQPINQTFTVQIIMQKKSSLCEDKAYSPCCMILKCSKNYLLSVTKGQTVTHTHTHARKPTDTSYQAAISSADSPPKGICCWVSHLRPDRIWGFPRRR